MARNKKIQRVCLYGGPGLGKSLTAMHLTDELCRARIPAEFVSEYVKGWAYINRKPESWDQVYLFAKQMHKEDVVLRKGKSSIVTECPMFLGICYAKKYKSFGWEHLAEMDKDFEKMYPSFNILIDRADCPYEQYGRFQDLAGAKAMDRCIKKCMDQYGIKYEVVKYNDREKMLSLAKHALSGK